MRQVRVDTGMCSDALKSVKDIECVPFASSTTKFSEQSYGNVRNMTPAVARAFTYTSNDEFNDIYPWIWYGSFRGYESFYDMKQGGFQIDLPRNIGMYKEYIRELRNNVWVDDYTSGIFLSINFFNTNLDMAATLVVLFEFITLGGSVLVKHTISTTRITPMYTEFDYVRKSLETASFAVFLIFFLLRAGTQFRRLFGTSKESGEAKNKSEADKSKIRYQKCRKLKKLHLFSSIHFC